MAKTRTITLAMDAYTKLRDAKWHPRESFTDVIRRTHFVSRGITAGELLALAEARTSFLSEADLDAIEEADRNDLPPDDPWSEQQ